jgi:hypothetical protein
MPMPRWALITAGAAVFCAVASQILVPSLGERTIEDRLTEGGGTAEVTLGAFPAARLLFSDGERFEVSGRELELALDPAERVFDRLDGFSRVDVAIADSTAGPIALERFELSRDGDGPYALVASGSTSPSSLVDYGIEAEIPGGGIADLVLDLFGVETNAVLPIELDMELSSDDGRVRVVSGGGTVAGVPTGPLAELITAAIVVRL